MPFLVEDLNHLSTQRDEQLGQFLFPFNGGESESQTKRLNAIKFELKTGKPPFHSEKHYAPGRHEADLRKDDNAKEVTLLNTKGKSTLMFLGISQHWD